MMINLHIRNLQNNNRSNNVDSVSGIDFSIPYFLKKLCTLSTCQLKETFFCKTFLETCDEIALNCILLTVSQRIFLLPFLLVSSIWWRQASYRLSYKRQIVTVTSSLISINQKLAKTSDLIHYFYFCQKFNQIYCWESLKNIANTLQSKTLHYSYFQISMSSRKISTLDSVHRYSNNG